MRAGIVVDAVLLITVPTFEVRAETLVPSEVFEGLVPMASPNAIAPASPNAIAPASPNAIAPTGHVSVQTWKLSGPKDIVHELPLHGFYLARLLSGTIAITIDGQTIKQPASKQPASAYWNVRAGATMQISVLSELAVIETTVVTKQ
jgi:hypothetical protein